MTTEYSIVTRLVHEKNVSPFNLYRNMRPVIDENIFIFNFAAGDRRRTAFTRAYYPSLYKNGYRPGIRAKINIRITSIAEALSGRERKKKKKKAAIVITLEV